MDACNAVNSLVLVGLSSGILLLLMEQSVMQPLTSFTMIEQFALLYEMTGT